MGASILEEEDHGVVLFTLRANPIPDFPVISPHCINQRGLEKKALVVLGVPQY